MQQWAKLSGDEDSKGEIRRHASKLVTDSARIIDLTSAICHRCHCGGNNSHHVPLSYMVSNRHTVRFMASDSEVCLCTPANHHGVIITYKRMNVP